METSSLVAERVCEMIIARNDWPGARGWPHREGGLIGFSHRHQILRCMEQMGWNVTCGNDLAPKMKWIPECRAGFLLGFGRRLDRLCFDGCQFDLDLDAGTRLILSIVGFFFAVHRRHSLSQILFRFAKERHRARFEERADAGS